MKYQLFAQFVTFLVNTMIYDGQSKSSRIDGNALKC
jgi:hypothetical protein